MLKNYTGRKIFGYKNLFKQIDIEAVSDTN